MGSRRLVTVGATSILLVVAVVSANALDLNGGWATGADNCAKVFVHKGAQFGFTDMSDVYGGGFIIEGDQIIGKFARCRIKEEEEQRSKRQPDRRLCHGHDALQRPI